MSCSVLIEKYCDTYAKDLEERLCLQKDKLPTAMAISTLLNPIFGLRPRIVGRGLMSDRQYNRARRDLVRMIQDILDTRSPTIDVELLASDNRGSSTRLHASCFFPCGNHFLWSLSKSKYKQTDEQQRERCFLTMHINRSIALANYCMPINHNIWLHQCQLSLIHNLATVRACWITFNMPWLLQFVVFFEAGAVMSKLLACTHNLHPGNQPVTQQLQ